MQLCYMCFNINHKTIIDSQFKVLGGGLKLLLSPVPMVHVLHEYHNIVNDSVVCCVRQQN